MSSPKPTPPTREPPTAERRIGAVLASRLRDRARLDKAVASVPPAVRITARGLADHFVAAGYLTHYQAEKLLDGRSAGLVLGPYHVLAPLGRGGMGTVY